MSFTDDLLDIYKGVLTQPSEFFATENRRDGFGFSLKFAVVNLIISAILSTISVVVLGGASSALGEAVGGIGIGLIAGFTLIGTPIFGLIGLLISSALIHIFVAILGGENGYSETLSAIEYATAVQPLTAVFSFIPFLGSLMNLLVGLYAIFIQVKGIENFQELSLGRAIAAVLLPALIIFAIVIALVFLVIAGTFAGIAAA
jgi:hypothetical protein